MTEMGVWEVCLSSVIQTNYFVVANSNHQRAPHVSDTLIEIDFVANPVSNSVVSGPF